MERGKILLLFNLLLLCNIYVYGIPNNELIPINRVSYIGYPRDNFMRTNDNNIVFVGPTKYLDINSMTINTLNLPNNINGENIFYLRPPFSNNKILASSRDSGIIYLYDLINQEASITNNVSIWSLMPDNDRQFVTFLMSTSEWWLGCLNRGYTLWLIRKDGNPLLRNENTNPLELILGEFNETIFDNDFILETIQNINETRENLITRDIVIFFSGRRSDGYGDHAVQIHLDHSNAFYYFVNRMSVYFNIDIQSIFGFSDRSFPLIKNSIGIYENGFFIIEDVKFLLLDVKNNETRFYIINEAKYVQQEGFAWGAGDIGFEAFITNDSRTLLLKRTNSRTGENIIYKYEFAGL